MRGKGGRHDRLPLPVDVGQAIVSYLQRRGRERVPDGVSCGCTRPRGALTRMTVAASFATRACARALPPVGAHRLRHTAATEMLREGASLAEIGQVLRHREPKTTAIYALGAAAPKAY